MLRDRIYWALRNNGDKWNERTGPGRYFALTAWAGYSLMNLLTHPLARGRRVQIVRTVARWETVRRLKPRDTAVDLSVGVSVLCPPWLGEGRTYLSLGYPDYRECTFLVDVLRPGDLFVDVGAFVGAYSMVAASQGARVHAFEPSPRNRDPLGRSVLLNGLSGQVTVHPEALADQDGEARFTDSFGSGNRLRGGQAEGAGAGSRGTGGEGEVVVPVRRLDDVIATSAHHDLALLKIDAEGFDLDVLRGAAAFLSRHDPVLIIEFWQGGTEVQAWLREHGYGLFDYDATRHELMDARVGPNTDGNLIACRPDTRARVDERIGGGLAHTELVGPTVRWSL
jgi:FkbM family methyltransferase